MVPAAGSDRLAAATAPSTKTGPLEGGHPLWVGTAGFSYPDWIGPVYGGAPGKGGDALRRLSSWVDLLEANVSHYRIPPPATAAGWLRATADRPAFRFTAKLWRGFTHGPERPTVRDLAAMRDFLSALASDGRFVAALAQFPPSFRFGERERDYVARLADHFSGTRVAVEFRHASWDREDVRAALAERSIAWVSADLPQGAQGVVGRAAATTDLVYLRLHGRSPGWFERGVGRDRRYDWLYSPEELRPWMERIDRLREGAAVTVVVFNNHYSGKALVNALEWKAASLGTRVEVPPSLVAAYPRLAEIARTD